jgi:hypothetical protein
LPSAVIMKWFLYLATGSRENIAYDRCMNRDSKSICMKIETECGCSLVGLIIWFILFCLNFFVWIIIDRDHKLKI